MFRGHAIAISYARNTEIPVAANKGCPEETPQWSKPTRSYVWCFAMKAADRLFNNERHQISHQSGRLEFRTTVDSASGREDVASSAGGDASEDLTSSSLLQFSLDVVEGCPRLRVVREASPDSVPRHFLRAFRAQ
jgi:hypothetical protein